MSKVFFDVKGLKKFRARCRFWPAPFDLTVKTGDSNKEW